MTSTPERDQPTILLGAAWVAHHGRQLDTIPDDDLGQAYRAARDLANALGAEKYRRATEADDGNRVQVIRHGIPVGAGHPHPDDVLALANVISAACHQAYERDCLPSSLTVADAILAAGYHRNEGE